MFQLPAGKSAGQKLNCSGEANNANHIQSITALASSSDITVAAYSSATAVAIVSNSSAEKAVSSMGNCGVVAPL